ncbi:MAG TPA: histidinol-phosphate transaminase [bacterium]|nr:histidinol-phosphate transaminase [bacterium]
MNPFVLAVRPYSPGMPLSAIRREFGLDEVIQLSCNENAAGPSPLAMKALDAAIFDIHRYPDDEGPLKLALAHRHGVPVNSVVLGHGATDILEIIVRTFINPGDQIVSAVPAFPWFHILGQLSGAENVLVPLREHRHDLEAMAAKVTEKTKLVMIANPNNPTGTLLPPAEIGRFIESLPENVLVVLDEAYIEYADPGQDFPLQPELHPSVIMVRTFSKMSGLAGLRIGYGVCHPKIVDLLEKVRQPFNTTALAHAAALASLQDTDHIEKSRSIVREGKVFLYREFERLGLDYVPTQTNFIFVDFHRPAAAITQALMKKGILIRPVPENAARITIGSAVQNARLVGALESNL